MLRILQAQRKLVLQQVTWLPRMARLTDNFIQSEDSIDSNCNKLIFCKTGLMWVVKREHRFSTRFAVMLQHTLHVFAARVFSYHSFEEIRTQKLIFSPVQVLLRVVYKELPVHSYTM